MPTFTRRCMMAAFGAAALLAAAPGGQSLAQDKEPIRVAFGDIASVETLNFLIAIERTKEHGVPVDVTFFNSEDVAAQAVVSGQADIGVGTPYALIQKSRAPIRMFFRMSSLRFFPVVNTEFYQDWKDLDGQEIAVHSRGSGTEALMNLMAQEHGIEYSNVSYVPGAEVRAGAMLQGNIKATIVDSAAFRMLQERGGDKFKALDMGDIDATDEALYANENFLEKRSEDVTVLVEELLKTWREISADPTVVEGLREQYGLLQDLPADLASELVPYYEDAAQAGTFPPNGGTAEQVQADFDFYTVAGQLQGNPDELEAEDFWNFGPLNKALETVGKS